MSPKLRLLRLESGESIFEVARDPSRPFVVETGPISIRVIGTRFDVYREEFSTRVAVIEGAVQVSSHDTTSGGNTVPLTTLQQLDIPDDPAHPRVRRRITSDDFRRITAWTHGDIEFDNRTLKEILSEVARYQPIHFEFKDPRIGELMFSGVLHTTDVRSLLELLKLRCIDSEYDETTQRITLTSEPGKSAGTACR